MHAGRRRRGRALTANCTGGRNASQRQASRGVRIVPRLLEMGWLASCCALAERFAAANELHLWQARELTRWGGTSSPHLLFPLLARPPSLASIPPHLHTRGSFPRGSWASRCSNRGRHHLKFHSSARQSNPLSNRAAGQFSYSPVPTLIRHRDFARRRTSRFCRILYHQSFLSVKFVVFGTERLISRRQLLC